MSTNEIDNLCNQSNTPIFYQSEADVNFYLFLKHEDILWNVPHYHNSMEMICVTQGEAIAHIDGKEYRILPNQICFVNPKQIHFYDNYCNEAKRIVLVLEPEFTYHFKRQFKNKFFTPFMADVEKNKPIVSQLMSFLNEKPHSYLSICGHTNTLLDLLVKAYPPIEQEVQPLNNLAKQFIDYISEYYKSDISLSSMAQYFGYSTVHFSKLFNKTLGQNFLTVLNNYRMQKAIELLNSPNNDKTIANICYECGFNSTATFYRHYAEYQKRMQNIPIH